jgi:precorrin-2 dehydrogenase
MKYYPAFLRVAGRPCLVIGGGTAAERKIDSLLRSGAVVTVISPQLTPTLAALAATQQVTHHQRRYHRGDLQGFFLAYAATDDEGVHAAIAEDASAAGVLLNVVDRPHLCHFIVPSVMERGDLIIATSTSAASPALAKRIRRDLEARFGPEYALALELLRRLREHLRGGARSAADRRRIFDALVDSPLLDYLRDGQAQAVDRLLATTVGADVSLASLGLELS